MPIQTSDLLLKLSTRSGSAGNSLAQADPNASLGKYISTTAWAGGVLHDLFDVQTGDENAAQTVDYRCIFIHNAHATLTWYAAKVWLEDIVAGGANIAIGIDPAAASAIGSASAQAAEIATENAAPAGVSFSAPETKEDGLSLGDLAPGQCRAIWVRRTGAASAALDDDGALLKAAGDTTE